LGTPVFVGFNWMNDSLVMVNVTFAAIPENHSLAEISELAHAAIVKEFKQEPKQILISFAINPTSASPASPESASSPAPVDPAASSGSHHRVVHRATRP